MYATKTEFARLFCLGYESTASHFLKVLPLYNPCIVKFLLRLSVSEGLVAGFSFVWHFGAPYLHRSLGGKTTAKAHVLRKSC